MIDIFKQVQVKRNDGIVASHNKFKLGQMSICFVGSSFCLIAYGKACGLIQARLKFKIPRVNNDIITISGIKISIRIKTRKEREYSFPIRMALIHRLKVRMMPFKDAEKRAKVFMEKFMDIVALFLMPLSYVTFKGSCSSN